jgi:hypothetical protein
MLVAVTKPDRLGQAAAVTAMRYHATLWVVSVN